MPTASIARCCHWQLAASIPWRRIAPRIWPGTPIERWPTQLRSIPIASADSRRSPCKTLTKPRRNWKLCIHTYGFVGALLEGTVAGAFLDQPRFLPVFEAAQALNVPIYLHPAPPPPAVNQAYFSDLEPPLNQLLATAAWGWHVETGLHCLRLIASGLFDRLPRLRMIVGHMGENLPFSIARADTVMRRAGLPLKRSIQEYFLEHFWITTSGYFSVPPLLCAREVMGADRILLSIDYPFSDLDNGHRLLQALNTHLPPGEIEKIAWKNAAALLRL